MGTISASHSGHITHAHSSSDVNYQNVPVEHSRYTQNLANIHLDLGKRISVTVLVSVCKTMQNSAYIMLTTQHWPPKMTLMYPLHLWIYKNKVLTLCWHHSESATLIHSWTQMRALRRDPPHHLMLTQNQILFKKIKAISLYWYQVPIFCVANSQLVMLMLMQLRVPKSLTSFKADIVLIMHMLTWIQKKIVPQ